MPKNKSSIIKLRAFIGFQHNSPHHTMKDIDTLQIRIKNHFKRIGHIVCFEFTIGKFFVGENMVTEVQKKIKDCDVAIFDISENNANVFFEAGFAYGKKKHVVFLKAADSMALNPTPSDIKPFIYLSYNIFSNLFKKEHLDRFADSVTDFINEKYDPYFFHRALWNLNENTKTIIIPGKLPEERADNTFNDYMYIREKADLDSVFLVLETLSRIYPNMELEVRSAVNLNDLNIHKRVDNNNLVIIGGPDFNPIAKEFEYLLPFKYDSSGDEVLLIDKKTKKILKPKLNKKLEQATDFGFFVRTKIPGKKSKLVMFGGCRTWGVYGASMLVCCTSDHDKNEDVRKIVLNFGMEKPICIPIKVKGTLKGIHPPTWSIRDVRILPSKRST